MRNEIKKLVAEIADKFNVSLPAALVVIEKSTLDFSDYNPRFVDETEEIIVDELSRAGLL